MSSRQLYRQPRTPEQIVEELHGLPRRAVGPADRRPRPRADRVGRARARRRTACACSSRRLPRHVARARRPARRGRRRARALVTETLERALERRDRRARPQRRRRRRARRTASTWSLAIVDHKLPDGLGMRGARRAARRRPGDADRDAHRPGLGGDAVEAFRHGASDYVVKGGALPRRAREPRPRPGAP